MHPLPPGEYLRSMENAPDRRVTFEGKAVLRFRVLLTPGETMFNSNFVIIGACGYTRGDEKEFKISFGPGKSRCPWPDHGQVPQCPRCRIVIQPMPVNKWSAPTAPVLALQPLIQFAGHQPASRVVPRLFCSQCFEAMAADHCLQMNSPSGQTTQIAVKHMWSEFCSTFDRGPKDNGPVSAFVLFNFAEFDGLFSAVEKDFFNYMQGLMSGSM